MRGVLPAIGVCALLLASQPALAETAYVEGTIVSRGSSTLHGTLEGRSSLEMIYFEPPSDHGSATTKLAITNGRFRLFEQPIYSASEGAMNSYVHRSGSVEEVRNETFIGLVSVHLTEADAMARILPMDADVLTTPLRLTGSHNITHSRPTSSSEFVPTVQGQQFTTWEPMATIQSDEAVLLQADARAIFYGTAVTLEREGQTEVVQTGRFSRQDLAAPGGVARTRIDVDVFVVVVGQTVAELSASGGGWHYGMSGFDGTLTGDIAFEATTTSTTINKTLASGDYGLVQLLGDFQVNVSTGPEGSTWQVVGTASAVALNGRPFFESTSGVKSAVAGGAGFAALVWVALRYGRDLLVLAGFTRKIKMDNEARRLILRFVGVHPGSTPMDMARNTGYHRNTVKFHLAVLERAGLVSATRHGRFKHFVTCEEGVRPVHSKDALRAAAMRQPGRQAIIDALAAASRPLGYTQMAAIWKQATGTSMSRTTFLHHAAKLEALDLIFRRTRGKQTVWTLNEALAPDPTAAVFSYQGGFPAQPNLQQTTKALETIGASSGGSS